MENLKRISIIIILIIILSIGTMTTTNASENGIENSINSPKVDLIEQPILTRTSTSPAGEQPGISGKTFYIKNMFTGQYLDIAGGVAANGTNVQQYKYNGSNAQKWYAHYNSDGTYTFFTPLGNDGTYRYALDISGGSADNYANVQIYTPNFTDSQKFSLGVTNLRTYVLFTKVSNYQKAVVLNGPTCNEGGNIDQYTFQAHYNECWILEPVNVDADLGVKYAQANYNQYVPAYPKLTNFGTAGEADCANFVSQCMLSSGIHYTDKWKVYRKNENYSQPANVTQLDNTWELCQPNTSPWTSAKEFGSYWKNKVNIHYMKGSYILSHPQEVMDLNITKGDVIQIADATLLGGLGNSTHTMYVTNYGTYNGNKSYVLTYHSGEEPGKNLLKICESNPNSYFVFYHMI